VIVFLETIKINRAHVENEIAKRVSDTSPQRVSDELAKRIRDTVQGNDTIASRMISMANILGRKTEDRADEADYVIALHNHCGNQDILAYSLALVSLSGAVIPIGERQ
jgi:hypothetical protein